MSSDAQTTAPRSVDVKYTCDCGTEFPSTVHHAVNVTLEPRLLYALLAGKLNVATCPNCGRQIVSDLPFVYHDMKRGLFAYVHPDGDLPEEDRDQILEELRRVYTHAVQESERVRPPRPSSRPRRTPPLRDSDRVPGVREPDAPPMQVIFGTDRLVALVESLLEPEERLGHIALHTDSQDPAARERFVSVAGRMAAEMGCEMDAVERAGRYIIDIYGPRSRIGQLVSMLHRMA